MSKCLFTLCKHGTWGLIRAFIFIWQGSFVSMFSSRVKIVNTHTLHVRLPSINRKSSERKHRANIKRTWINVNFSIILFLFTSMYSSWRTRWDGKSFFPLYFWWTSKLSLAIASFFSYLFSFFNFYIFFSISCSFSIENPFFSSLNFSKFLFSISGCLLFAGLIWPIFFPSLVYEGVHVRGLSLLLLTLHF